jgi:deoxyribodipyrimidine photo-lyase
MTENFPPSRAEGLARLQAFVPRAGHHYATGRNHDPGPGQRQDVSLLSPYVRHRLITEREVVAAVLAAHRWNAAEKFVQEVLWRTYWKGWLELRPAVWERFVGERDAAPRGADVAAAEAGRTGIDCFDAWARELVATGYLHNHARMWFASIWIFTLRLPWALGADFFLRHLIDADPASNTLSWRWVAGLQTAGKTYLASADNIARYTGGRFAPQGLAREAMALTEAPLPGAGVLPGPAPRPAGPALLLVTAEDLHPESVFAAGEFGGAVVVTGRDGGALRRAFVAGAAADAAARVAGRFGCPVRVVDEFDAGAVLTAAEAAGVRSIVTACAPVGPVQAALAALAGPLAAAGVPLVQQRRGWDTRFWQLATKGFFPFREKIAAGLAAEGIV